MQLPHKITLVTPIEIADEYGNPVSTLDYGSAARRRDALGLMQPQASTEKAQPGRQVMIARWRLFIRTRLAASERVEWRGRVFEVEAAPEVWSTHQGHRHTEATLRLVGG